jgi:pilus assembly protein FimV
MGDMAVLSEFGEPLRAEIEISGLDAAAADTLDAAIGSPADYASLGLRYPSALDGALVRIQRRPGGRVTVRIATRAPIAESELNMVLALTTRGERSLRNYQLIGNPPAGGSTASNAPAPAERAETPLRLDLVPVVPQAEASAPRAADPSTSSAATSAATSAASPFVPAQPVASPPPPERAEAGGRAETMRRPEGSRPPSAMRAPASERAAAPGPTASGERSVRVQPGETASAIARRFKPADIDESQAIMALYRRNQALFGGSVHRLPAGVTLTLPDETEIRQVPRHEARAAIRSRDEAAVAPAAPRSDRLVISGDESAPADSRGKMGTASATRAAALDAAKAEADSRIRDLQKNVDDLNRLLELRDRQLAKLQDTARRVADERDAASSAGGPASTGAAAAGPIPVSASASAADTAASNAAGPVASPPPLRPAPEPVAQAQPMPAPAPAETGWFADWRIQAAAGVLAAVFVLAGVAFTLRATRPGGARGLTGGGRDWRAPAGGGGQPTSVARR